MQLAGENLTIPFTSKRVIWLKRGLEADKVLNNLVSSTGLSSNKGCLIKESNYGLDGFKINRSNRYVRYSFIDFIVESSNYNVEIIIV